MENNSDENKIYLLNCGECEKEILLDKHNIIIDEDEMKVVYHRECYLGILRTKSDLPLVNFDLKDISGLRKDKFTKEFQEKNKGNP